MQYHRAWHLADCLTAAVVPSPTHACVYCSCCCCCGLLQVPAGSSILSGVYELMSQGQVTPYHRDHPSRRRLQGKCMDAPQDEAGQGQDEQLLQYTFHSSGLQLESSQFSAYGR